MATSSDDRQPRYLLVDPRGTPTARSVTKAPRVRELSGLMVGFINNRKWNVTELYDRVGAVLARDYGAQFLQVKKETPARPASDGIRTDLLAKCHAIVSGIGD